MVRVKVVRFLPENSIQKRRYPLQPFIMANGSGGGFGALLTECSACHLPGTRRPVGRSATHGLLALLAWAALTRIGDSLGSCPLQKLTESVEA